MSKQVQEVVARIKAEREKKGLSQSEAAREMQTTSQYWCQIEGGTKTPKLDQLIRMAHAVGLELTWKLSRQKAKPKRKKRVR